MESIALQESALSHILCAESQKMKTALAMNEIDLCKLLEVNDSATNMVHAVANLELVLKDKLEFVSNNLYPSACGCRSEVRRCGKACPDAGRAFSLLECIIFVKPFVGIADNGILCYTIQCITMKVRKFTNC